MTPSITRSGTGRVRVTHELQAALYDLAPVSRKLVATGMLLDLHGAAELFELPLETLHVALHSSAFGRTVEDEQGPGARGLLRRRDLQRSRG